MKVILEELTAERDALIRERDELREQLRAADDSRSEALELWRNSIINVKEAADGWATSTNQLAAYAAVGPLRLLDELCVIAFAWRTAGDLPHHHHLVGELREAVDNVARARADTPNAYSYSSTQDLALNPQDRRWAAASAVAISAAAQQLLRERDTLRERLRVAEAVRDDARATSQRALEARHETLTDLEQVIQGWCDPINLAAAVKRLEEAGALRAQAAAPLTRKPAPSTRKKPTTTRNKPTTTRKKPTTKARKKP